MRTSIELLDKALEGGDTQRELSRKLGMTSSTLSVARHRKRLSPTAAGALAAYIGADVPLWTALAALEAEPPSQQRDSLFKKLEAAIEAFERAQPIAVPWRPGFGTQLRWDPPPVRNL